MRALPYPLLLSRAESAGVHAMPIDADFEMSDAAEELEYPLHRVELAGVTDKHGFLQAVGAALAFPDWYGHNWDALADCLADLSWMAADGYVVVLANADAFAAASPADFATAMTIFQEAADTWRADGVPFWTLVGTAGPALPGLPELE